MEKLHLINAETLFYTPLDHPRMLIDGILSNGLAILSGDSKIGKSWMVLWFCLKISRGDPVWGLPTSKTDVIYLALEDKDWRIQQRMQDLIDVPPTNLHFGFTCGKEHDGSNVFNDMTGSTGIAGVADTCMVLRKEDRFGNDAVLSNTGRDIEEKRLKLAMRKNVWEVHKLLRQMNLTLTGIALKVCRENPLDHEFIWECMNLVERAICKLINELYRGEEEFDGEHLQ